MKNFLITYNNTSKFRYINNYLLVLHANAECLLHITGRRKFTALTQMPFSTVKSNNLRHLSTTVRCKASHLNNGPF